MRNTVTVIQRHAYKNQAGPVLKAASIDNFFVNSRLNYLVK